MHRIAEMRDKEKRALNSRFYFYVFAFYVHITTTDACAPTVKLDKFLTNECAHTKKPHLIPRQLAQD